MQQQADDSMALEARASCQIPVSTGGSDSEETEKTAGVTSDDETTIKIVQWDVGDARDPRNLPKARKWMVVMILATSCAWFTCASSIYTTTYEQITVDFNCSRLVATIGLSLYVLGMAFGPMLFGGLSEYWGRRKIFIASFTLFSVFLIPCALARSLEVLLTFRFLSGLVGSALLSVAGGTVVDLFVPMESQPPMMIFTASPFIGPVLGPLIGGFINENLNWRVSFYLMLGGSIALLLAIIFLVPETYHPVLLALKAEAIREKTGDPRWKSPLEAKPLAERATLSGSFLGPFRLLATEPKCLCLCIYTAILLGIIYLFFGAFNLVFRHLHDFSLSQVGLAFIGMLLGIIAAILVEPYCRWAFAGMFSRYAPQDSSAPEHRLYSSLLGAILVPVGLFMFGWTLSASIHWVFPVIGSALFGAGTVLVYCGVFAFLVAEYPAAAASALSANCFLRCGFAAAFPLFGIQMYEGLGYAWATSALGFLTVAMAPFPYIFFAFGSRLKSGRVRSLC
ncbi:MFS transporter [Thozetella sp. PMI_491]|nr:MFS transporter [Thozetella sp. PMI_491]